MKTIHVQIWVGLWFALTVFAAPILAQPLPDTIDRIRPSIVGIGSWLPTRTPRAQLLGTGFVIGNGRQVITNAHVVDYLEEKGKLEELRVFVGRGPSPQIRSARVVATDAQHDLSLLEIGGAPVPVLTLGAASMPREGERLAFTGFPIGAVLGLYPVTHHAMVSAITPIVAPQDSGGQLTATVISRLRQPFDVLQLDATAYPGNSGSPLYEMDTGAVVGVMNMVFVKESRENILQKPSGIAYAIPVRYVHALLRENGSGSPHE